ncbi:MAG TPA: type II toxin-antitoxin system PemK/MazF family toxin [Candidatus Absconditabacterales bacterium]|nr:type II toxin-antitoxin system PemK/MazF family toxin [Candidatus Absconditabacterales bacterium]HMT26884.1 type II toxin-antitoxin system PemK/MazF family toxin [Candidatus Absconditabacterales bacterium]
MVYTKKFDDWNNEKKRIDEIKLSFFPKSREIRYCKLGVNIGFEADGKGEFSRPVLVIQKIGSLFFCIPMTTKHKDNCYHYKLLSISFDRGDSSLMLSQGRIIDHRRFQENIGKISKLEFLDIKKLLKEMYLPEDS